MEASVEPQPRGPDWMPITPKTGSLFHADSQRDLAKLLDDYLVDIWDPVPLVVTIAASHIKAAVLRIYRGATSMTLDPTAPPIGFTQSELLAFRERFRRQPLTDEDYLDFANDRLGMLLRLLHRKNRARRYPKSPIASRKCYQPRLDPRRHRGDYPMRWPVEPGTRMFEPQLRCP